MLFYFLTPATKQDCIFTAIIIKSNVCASLNNKQKFAKVDYMKAMESFASLIARKARIKTA